MRTSSWRPTAACAWLLSGVHVHILVLSIGLRFCHFMTRNFGNFCMIAPLLVPNTCQHSKRTKTYLTGDEGTVGQEPLVEFMVFPIQPLVMGCYNLQSLIAFATKLGPKSQGFIFFFFLFFFSN